MHPCIQHGSKGQENMGRDIVRSYMLDHNFTKNRVNDRPETIGEEHDVVSLSGRSSHSSISGKTENSTATPRRTDIDLGYEPEGSASPLPAHERWKLSLYNMLHDSEGIAAFKTFLSRSNQEGILECWLAMKGFRDFDRPKSSGNSSAASSTTGSLSSKNNQVSDLKSDMKIKLAKIIFKTYLTTSAAKCVSTIKNATRQYILKQIKEAVNNKNGGGLDSDLFLQAQTEIEHNVEANSYKKFLDSPEFSKFAAQCDSLNSRASANLTPQSNLSQSPRNTEPTFSEPPTEQHPSQPVTGSSQPYLPRLDEDQVWSPPNGGRPTSGSSHPATNVTLTSNSLAKIAMQRAMYASQTTAEPSQFPVGDDEVSDAFPYFTPGVPYWVPPASAIGSDQASKSSDATSDTLSFTDNSSVDGITPYSSSRQGQKRMMRNHIKNNPSNALPECKEHVQRTSRMKNIPDLATKNPRAFFEQLRAKLLKYIAEEQKHRQMRMTAAQRGRSASSSNSGSTAATTMRCEDEDLDEILESHIQRAISSPGGRHSPPLGSGKRTRQPPIPSGHDAFYGQQKIPIHRDSSGFAAAPMMLQNKVPDVPTPVIPVDKNQMISAWIQTPMQTQQLKKKKEAKKGRSSGPSEEALSEEVHYVHPVGSTGLQSVSTNRKLQPLAQDPTMPPFDLPDAGTTIEEVKRRLMEETEDGSYDDLSAMQSLQIGESPQTSTTIMPSHLPPYNTTMPETTSSTLRPQRSSSFPPTNPAIDQPSCSDTDSSSETATISNVNSSSHQKQVSESITTVVYYMPHEETPYRIKVPSNPLTLGQFKAVLAKKGKFKYFFKQRSMELKRPVFFEVSKDDEQLPYWEGIVLAKIDPCPA